MTIQSPPSPVHTLTGCIQPIQQQLDRHLDTCQNCKRLTTHTHLCALAIVLHNTITVMNASIARSSKKK